MTIMPSGRLIAQVLLLQLLLRCYAADTCETCMLPVADLLQVHLQAIKKRAEDTHVQALHNQAQAAIPPEQAHTLAPASQPPITPKPAKVLARCWAT